MEVITQNEKLLLLQFRERICDLELKSEELEDKNLVRWTRARKNSLEDAEEMLRKHVEWRQQIQIEELMAAAVTDAKLAKTFYEVLFPFYVSGFDYLDNPVCCIPVGRWDVRGVCLRGEREDFERYGVACLELGLRTCARASLDKEWMGQIVAIYDFEQFSLSQVMSCDVVKCMISFVQLYTSNYPEVLRKAFVINAPRAFQISYKILTPTLDQRTMGKIQVLGGNKAEWRQEIGKLVPFDQFPKMYGGDGDNSKKVKVRVDGSTEAEEILN